MGSCWPALAAAAGAGSADEAERFFESKVRPLLVERCYKCHSADQSQGRAASSIHARPLLNGGETGAAVVVGKPDESLLVEAVRQQNGLAMPPDGKLNEVQIAALTDWIKAGAIWPGEAAAVRDGGGAGDHSIVPNVAQRRRAGRGARSFGCGPIRWRSATESLVYVWPDQSGHARDVSATKGVRAGGVGLPARFVRESTLLKRPGVRFEHDARDWHRPPTTRWRFTATRR